MPHNRGSGAYLVSPPFQTAGSGVGAERGGAARDRARREREAALAERASLVQENRYLLRTLRGVREALEQREARAYQTEKKESNWKRVQDRADWHRY
ncbi:UNVERIFIED_CONTAM: hypothetical protein FKN15_015571 [Acipenser sinensis]